MLNNKNTIVIVSVVLLAAGMFFLGSHTAKKESSVTQYRLEEKIKELEGNDAKIAALQTSYDSLAKVYESDKIKFEADEAKSNEKIKNEKNEKIAYINSLGTGDSFKLFSEWLSEIAGNRERYSSSNHSKPNEGLKPVQGGKRSQ